MGITEATKEDDDGDMMAESNMMVDRDEDYNTRYGGYKGSLLAFERTKLIPRRPADDRSDGDDPRPPAPTRSRRSSITSLTGFCRCRWRTRTRACSSISCAASSGRSRVQPGETLEESLRELLYLVLEHAGVSVGIERPRS